MNVQILKRGLESFAKTKGIEAKIETEENGDIFQARITWLENAFTKEIRDQWLLKAKKRVADAKENSDNTLELFFATEYYRELAKQLRDTGRVERSILICIGPVEYFFWMSSCLSRRFGDSHCGEKKEPFAMSEKELPQWLESLYQTVSALNDFRRYGQGQ